MSRIIDVVAGILWQEGRYLAVDRPKGEWAGWWEFPGGKVEPEEFPEAALVRELREELGIETLAHEFWQEKIHHYETVSVRLFFYHVTRFKGIPQGLEGQNLRWLSPESPNGVRFLPADDELILALKNGVRPSEK